MRFEQKETHICPRCARARFFWIPFSRGVRGVHRRCPLSADTEREQPACWPCHPMHQITTAARLEEVNDEPEQNCQTSSKSTPPLLPPDLILVTQVFVLQVRGLERPLPKAGPLDSLGCSEGKRVPMD
jgi:hypothetical protein